MMKLFKLYIFLFLLLGITSAHAMTEDETIKMVETIAKDNAMDITITDAAKKLGYTVVGKTLYYIATNTNTAMSSAKMIRFSRALVTTNNKWKFPNKIDWIFILSDVLIDAMTYESDKANKLLIKTLYGNLKAGIQYGLATNALDKMGAGVTWGETNLKAFYGSVSGSMELYKEKVSLDISTKYAEDYSTIINLYKKYEKDYCRSALKDKDRIKNEFLTECITSFDGSSFFANADKTVAYRNWCEDYANRAELFDRSKLYNLFTLRDQGSYFFENEEDFNTYVNNFFHISNRNTVSRLWLSDKFDPEFQESKGVLSHYFLKRALLYGYHYFDFVFDGSGFIYNPLGKVENESGLFMIAKCYSTVTGNYINIPSSGLDNEYMTRAEASVYIVDTFNLTKAKPLFGSVENASFNFVTMPKVEILKSLGISTSLNIDGFRPNDQINAFELLVMLVKTMDYKTCGKVGCSEYSILNQQIGEQ